MTLISPISTRFGSIIPVKRVYSVPEERLLDPANTQDFTVIDAVVDHMEAMARGDFPYGIKKAPRPANHQLQQALIEEAQRFRDTVLQRLNLIDPDYASDPQKRLVTIGVDRDHFLLTGEDAQPTLDADRLQDTVLDKMGTEDALTQSQAEKEADAQTWDQVDAVYTAEVQRVREHQQHASPRGIQLNVIALPKGETFWGQVGASVLGLPPITITDMTVC